MSRPQAIDLTAAEAAHLIQDELDRAAAALSGGDLDDAFDRYVRCLGLALQLGPAPSELVLAAALQAALDLGRRHDAAGLSTLGPALVDLVDRVQGAGALPATATMRAWATVAAGMGALIGQAGLILALPPDHRGGMIDNARTRAALLDETTGGLFALAAWIDEEIDIGCQHTQ